MTSEYIYKLCKKSVPKSFQTFVSEMLDELKNNVVIDIVNIEKIYQNVSIYADQLIMSFLYSPIPYSYSINPNLAVIDLIFVKDKLDIINKKQQELVARKKLIQNKIDKLNSVFKELKREIKRACPPSTHKTFRINYGGAVGVHCCRISDATRSLNIERNKYDVKCLYFIRTDGNGFNLDNPLYLYNTLTLSITYRKKVIYSISEEIKNKLLAAQKEISDIININKDCIYIG